MDYLNEEGKKFIKKQTAEYIIKSYLAIQKLKEEKKYGNEYIQMLYKINPNKYEVLYNALDEELKKECETEIKSQIESGKLDLYDHLKEMYKKMVKAEKNEEIENDDGREH